MAIFTDVQYCIYADKVGGWGPNGTKICSRNIGMAPCVVRISTLSLFGTTMDIWKYILQYYMGSREGVWLE